MINTMPPVEILTIIEDDKGYVTAIAGSQELLDKCKDFLPEVKRIVKSPEMLVLKLPDIN